MCDIGVLHPQIVRRGKSGSGILPRRARAAGRELASMTVIAYDARGHDNRKCGF